MSHMQNETMDRGYIGLLPRPTKLADESYLEYVQSFRKMIIQDMFPVVAAGGEARYAVWKTVHKPNANSDDLNDIKREFRQAPVTLTWQRFLRTQQEMMWRQTCLLYTSPSPRDATLSRMPSSA